MSDPNQNTSAETTSGEETTAQHAMRKTKGAWEEFAGQMGSLGDQLTANLKSIASSASSKTESSQNSVDSAIDTIKRALTDVSLQISAAAADPKLREEGTDAATSLLKAVGTTLSDAGEACRKAASGEGSKSK